MGLLFLTLLGSTSLQAQSITPKTLNVTGGYAEVGGYSLGYSLGEESSISYYVNTLGFSISAGFLQDFSFASTISSVGNLQATVDNQTIEVSWEKPIENVKELVGYNLEISEDSLNYVLVSKTKELSYKIENLTNSQKILDKS